MKVAIYCRLSDEDKNKRSADDDSESIQNQKSMLTRYAKENGWDVYNIYSDDDYSGADRNRPAFNQLIFDARNRKFNIVLCKMQSRFTRETELAEKYLHFLFPKWGIRFVSIVDNVDTDNPASKKSSQINSLVNEWFLEDLSNSIRSAFKEKSVKGLHIGSFAVYGYKKDPNKKGHLLIDEEAAEIVREIFTLFSKGYGKTAIARRLNERGIPNPTEYKRRKGLRYTPAGNKNSCTWKYSGIAEILINEMYIGNMVQGRTKNASYKSQNEKINIPKKNWIIVANTHEPIIDIELWNAVQNLIKMKAKPFITGKIGLFARKVKCAHCGYTLRSHISRKEQYLQCPTRHTAKDSCIGSFISVRKLERIILFEIKEMTEKYLDTSVIEKEVILNNNLDLKVEKLKRAASEITKNISDITKGQNSLYINMIKGIIPEEEYIRLSKELPKEKELLDYQLHQINEDILSINNQKISREDSRKIISEYVNISTLNREILDKLINCIVVGKRDPSTKKTPIEVHWNF